jgi:hypothetical protein
MTGYQSKKAAALDKLNDDDDTQVYGDALTIAYQSGYYDGKKAAQRTWVGLTDAEVMEMMGYEKQYGHIPQYARNFVEAISAKLKEKNT